jgi:F5/8 type C domain
MSAGEKSRGGPPVRDVPFHVMALVFAVLVALAETWPLATRLGTHYPVLAAGIKAPISDQLLTSWILASDVHRLAHHPLSVFESNNLYPFRHTLAFSENLLGVAVLVWPVQALWGNPVLTDNVALLLSFVLGAYGVVLLVHELSGSALAAVVSATLATYTPDTWMNLTQLHVALYLFTPLGLFAFVRLVRTGSWRWSVLLGVLVAWQVWSSLHWGVFLVLGLAAGVPVLLVWSRDARRAFPQMLVAGLVAAVLVMPLVPPYEAVAREMDLGNRSFIAFLWSPWSPAPALAHFWVYLTDRFASGVRIQSAGSALAPWLAAAAGAAAAVLVRRPRTVDVPMVVALAAGGVVNWWYALGPVSWHAIPSLYGLLCDVPGLGVLRCPARAIFYSYLILAVVGGCGLAAILRRLPGRAPRLAVAATFVAISVVEAGWHDVPLAAAPPRQRAVQDAVDRLEPGCAIAELPTDLDRAAVALFRSTTDWRPLVTGYSGIYGVGVFLTWGLLSQFPAPSALAYLQRAGACAVVIHGDSPAGAAMLARSRASDLAMDVRGTEALVHLPPAPPEEPHAPLLDRATWQIVEPEEGAAEVLDGSLDTIRSFSATTPFAPERLAVDLGRPVEVSGIDLALGHSFRLFLWSYRIEGSLNGSDWWTIAAAPAAVPPLDSYRAAPARITQRFNFAPTTARFLRLAPYRRPPTAPPPAADAGFTTWGVAELYVRGVPAG